MCTQKISFFSPFIWQRFFAAHFISRLMTLRLLLLLLLIKVESALFITNGSSFFIDLHYHSDYLFHQSGRLLIAIFCFAVWLLSFAALYLILSFPQQQTTAR